MRVIRSADAAGFTSIAISRRHRKDTERYLGAMFAAGSMHPDRCYRFQQDGSAVGRCAFWNIPGRTQPAALVLLDLDWIRREHLEVGTQILGMMFDEARHLGATTIGYALDGPAAPPQWQHYQEERDRLMRRAGYALLRRTERVRRAISEPSPVHGERLVFRSVEDVGEQEFVQAIADVSEGTLDRELQAMRSKGSLAAARELYDIGIELGSRAGWSQLAFDRTGDLIGLVMLANPPEPVINYVAVMPRHRGRRYVDDLLAVAVRSLAASGAKELRADADVENQPMLAAFRRAGFVRFAMRRSYEIGLERSSPGVDPATRSARSH